MKKLIAFLIGFLACTPLAFPSNYSSGSGSAVCGGADTQLQYNDGGTCSGEAALTYNKTTDTLTAGTITATADLKFPTTTATEGSIQDGFGNILHTFTPTRTPTAAYGHNIFIGKGSGNRTMTGDGNPFGSGNFCAGEDSCSHMTNSYFDICIGNKSCHDFGGGSADNVCIGSETCSMLTGNTNYVTAIGDKAMYQAKGQIRRGVAIGTQSGSQLTNDGGTTGTADSFTFVGNSSGLYIVDSQKDVLIGTNVMSRASSASILPNSAENVMIGYNAGFDGSNWNPGVVKSVGIGSEVLKSVDDETEGNIAIGYNAGDNITTGEDNIIIGKSSDAPSATASQQLVIANALIGTSIYGTPKVGVGTTPDATNAVNLAGPAMIQQGGTANTAVCWLADGKTLGHCTTVVAADGTCTCVGAGS